jgi:hypothetical protein
MNKVQLHLPFENAFEEIELEIQELAQQECETLVTPHSSSACDSEMEMDEDMSVASGKN